MRRRLAAILAADVVGYSALMAEDEAGTLEKLRRMRAEVFNPAVAGHRGKIIKNMGDGWLVEFETASEAVGCALNVQQRLETNSKLRLRCGIHIGDIVHEEEDVFGDGVNVAARLEAIAVPGGTVLSDVVYSSLDGTLTPIFDDYGIHSLKNMPKPVQTWVHRTALSEVPNQQRRRIFKQLLTILPVSTSDPRAEVEELAAAISNDLLQYLSGARWLHASISERGQSIGYALSSRLRTGGDRLRLEVTLNGPDGSELLSDKVDGHLGQVFDWQDETAAKLSSAVFAVIEDVERTRLDALSKDEQTAETWMLRALLDVMAERSGGRRIVAACREVIERDPNWGRPYSLGLIVRNVASVGGWQNELDDLIEDPGLWLDRARELSSSDDPSGMVSLAFLQHRLQPDLITFRHKVNGILRHEPNNQAALLLSAFVFSFEGDPELGLAFGRRAVRYLGRSKTGVGAYAAMASACVQLGLDDDAVTFGELAITVTPDAPIGLWCAAAAFVASGRTERAYEVVSRLKSLAPSVSISGLSQDFAETTGMARFLDCLREAGIPERAA